MSSRLVPVAALFALIAALGPGWVQASDPTAMRTVEGVVLGVEPLAVDAPLPSLLVRLEIEGSPAEEMEILLAPPEALRETGFEIAAGDRVRARIFLGESGPLETHKIRNLSRGTMLLLRTLHRVPLWTGDGHWQGGPSRSPGAGHGARRGHGGG